MVTKRKPAGATKAIKTTLYLSEELHRRAKICAAERRTTLTELIVEGLKVQLAEKSKAKGRGQS
jgi:hypothetical protein